MDRSTSCLLNRTAGVFLLGSSGPLKGTSPVTEKEHFGLSLCCGGGCQRCSHCGSCSGPPGPGPLCFPSSPLGRGQAGRGLARGTDCWGMDRGTEVQYKSYNVGFGDRQMGSNPSLLPLDCCLEFPFLWVQYGGSNPYLTHNHTEHGD